MHRSRHLFLAILVCLLILGGTGVGEAIAKQSPVPSGYTIEVVSAIEGVDSPAIWSLNNAGRGAGDTFIGPSANTIPFLVANGKFKVLGPEGVGGSAHDLSDDGVVVGTIYGSDPSRTTAVILKTGGYDELGPGSAWAINESGQIAGDSNGKPVVWTDGQITELPLPDGATSGSAATMDSDGNAAGSAATAEGQIAVAWIDGEAIDLQAPAGNLVTAVSMNDSGTIVGNSYGENGPSGWIWQDGSLAPVITGTYTQCSVNKINSSGQIVGRCLSPDGSRTAVIWAGGDPIDLNTLLPADSGWVLANATANNDVGQIAGTGMLDGVDTLFILTPVQ